MNTSAAAQTTARPTPKILRIGVARAGRIVHEKLIRPGETVTVGDSPRNTFVLPGTGLPPRHEMFVARGGSYTLRLPSGIEAKISGQDGIRDLEELRARGEASRRGDTCVVPLTESTRGKLTIGDFTLLFQFVPAPPEPARQASDFRPRLIDEDDPLFMGLVSLFGVFAAGFMFWVERADLPQTSDLDEIDTVCDLVLGIPPLPLPDPSTHTGPDDAKKPTRRDTKSPRPTSSPPPKPIAHFSLLLQQLGTTGSTSAADPVTTLLGEEVASTSGLDAALRGVTGAETATAGDLVVHPGAARADATIRGVEGGTGRTAGTGAGAVTTVKRPRVAMDPGGVYTPGEGDGSGIPSVVRKSNGRIQTCVEQSLKNNPTLEGRVSVGWTIQAGRVTESHLVRNSTGDDPVGRCIVNAARSLRFDPGLTADVEEFSWIVRGR
jgi:hypothetical protein